MLPPSWGQPEPGPQRFDLVNDGEWVRERYRKLRHTRQLDEVFRIAREAGADYVYLDRPYIDFDYRSDLSHFYGRAFRPPPETTERLIFANRETPIGISVMRPLPQQVGRTLLPPPRETAPYITCIARMPINAFGYEWTVSGYPFTSQDGEYGVCAHAALWSIARYHHLRFGANRHTMSSIMAAAGLKCPPDKTARSDGMYAFDIFRAFREIGLPALQYDVDRLETTSKAPSKKTETPHSVIRRYLDSGIPVGVLFDSHMMVLVGYAEAADGEVHYIASDDNHSAYKPTKLVRGEDPKAWKWLVVPQPGRMHVNGEAAEARAEEAFEDRLRAEEGPGHLLTKWLRRQLRVCTYATPSSAYVNGLAGRGVPGPIRNHHVYAAKGNWLWVTEFQDTKLPVGSKVLGEIVIDATSLQLDPSPVLGNIDGWAYIWHPSAEKPLSTRPCPSGASYRSAIG